LWAVGCGLWVRVVAQDGKRAGDWEETGDDRCGLGCGVVVVGLEGASERASKRERARLLGVREECGHWHTWHILSAPVTLRRQGQDG